MKLLVCGGRDYRDAGVMTAVLDAIHGSDTPITKVVAGGAPGADTMAVTWALFENIPTEIFHADWNRDGRAAGPRRNQKMLDEAKPDLVLAFPGGSGTADMVRRSKRSGVRVMEVRVTEVGAEVTHE